MKVIKLSSDDIVTHWETIKYGILQAEGLQNGDTQKFCIGLLKNLLKKEYQCWFAINDKRNIKTVIITTITKDYGDTARFIILSGYGYIATSIEEKEQISEAFEKFCRNNEIKKMITYTNNEFLSNYYDKVGFVRKSILFERNIQ